MQHARCWRCRNAWNCTQVLIDRTQLVVRHVLVLWPRHDLQQVAVERRRNAIDRGAWRMQMIQVHPRAYDLAKFGERPAAFRLTGPVRRQIARHDVWSTRNQRAEVPASAEVSRLIHDSRLIEVGVAPRAYSVGGPAE